MHPFFQVRPMGRRVGERRRRGQGGGADRRGGLGIERSREVQSAAASGDAETAIYLEILWTHCGGVTCRVRHVRFTVILTVIESLSIFKSLYILYILKSAAFHGSLCWSVSFIMSILNSFCPVAYLCPLFSYYRWKTMINEGFSSSLVDKRLDNQVN